MKLLNIFGPVPSRRLGRSLGINNVPPKICSYSCIYCQLGRTNKMQINREVFYSPEQIKKVVADKLEDLKESRGDIDYLTFVADGEPTLDSNLGKSIEELKDFNIDIAVITNSSLLNIKEVRDDLKKADLVSIKCDAIDNNIWEKVNRPQGELKLEKILKGIYEFSENYSGKLITETMLIKNYNDSEIYLNNTADFLKGLDSEISYLAIPTRPPAEKYAVPPDTEVITRAYHILEKKNIKTEYLIGYEGNQFASSGNIKEDLLSITAVHPLKQEAVEKLL
ncbi:MAG: radical SAM protein, partial [bacterium]